ncbi:hypothetical protein [Rhizobium sp. B21/90]|uniref:hypothetical protein n=1 Tax=Rhizobium sp. B21/90 TaxID=2819993 RepID=UPI001C5B5CCE|nr:hypothetical protein [Rhizobium sp. B21/90]QYA03893.1 hypothetical protein J5278_24245 [Rhizobium sp. B21/90]
MAWRQDDLRYYLPEPHENVRAGLSVLAGQSFGKALYIPLEILYRLWPDCNDVVARRLVLKLALAPIAFGS